MLLVGTLSVRAMGRGLGRIVEATGRMASFDFAPSEPRAPFRDVEDVMRSLELAKTALRALGRYVPVDLVRELYRTGREPMLGGETAEVTMMFTDVKDFTSLSEGLTPDELARLLGLYLQAMTEAVHEAEGVIDKYVGDAVMAVWNAVRPCADHPEKACRAALACREATPLLARAGVVAAYEQALEACWRRDFEAALALLESQSDDAPSRMLAERCRIFRTAPPPPDWNGIHIATEK